VGVDVILFEEKWAATKRYLMDDDAEAVNVTGLSARHVRVPQPFLFPQQLGCRPQQRYSTHNTS